jgi:hydrogenase maturation protease
VSKRRKPLIKIIAVGNNFYGDDGIGSEILSVLDGMPEFNSCQLIDSATDALGFIDHFNDADHIIIIDAAKMGEIPGTVKAFSANDALLNIQMDHLSIHGISLAETFEIARAIGAMPNSITIIGIEPESFSITEGLSETVTKSIPQAVSRIIELNQDIIDHYRGNYA